MARAVPYVLSSMVPACVSRDFHAMATGKTSPVIEWLKALARKEHADCGGPGVGVTPGERGEQVDRQSGGDDRDGGREHPATTTSTLAVSDLGVRPGRGPNNMSAPGPFGRVASRFNSPHTRP
jgi:hypothetical protein